MRRELVNPREFVRFWFCSVRKFVMKPDGSFIGEKSGLFNSLWLDYKDYCVAEIAKNPSFDKKTGKRIKPSRINEKDMEKAWYEYLELAKEEARKGIVDQLLYNGTSSSDLGLWMQAVIGSYSEFELAVMKHFVWQVKRKLLDKPVVYTLAPCLWGEQGSGKTTAVQKLLEPVKALTAEWSPLEAVDQRNTQNLADNYVCFFDEMAGLARVEIESLKRIISADFTTYRPMYTNRQMKVKQNCTFIGVSNKALTENIYDPTGLRRFAELRCLSTVNWELVNKVNPINIWTSIDENKPRGYIEDFATEMKEHQEGLMILDEIQQFVKDQAVVVPPGTNGKEISATDLWHRYFDWRLKNGYGSRQAMVLNSFCMKLRTHGLQKRVRKIDGRERTVYYVNASSHIFEGPVSLVKETDNV